MTLSFEDNLIFDDIIVEEANIKYWEKRFEKRRELIGSTLIAQILHDYYSEDSDSFYHVHANGKSRAFPVLTKEEWTETTMPPNEVINSVSDEWIQSYDREFIWRTSMQQAALTVDSEYAPVELNVRDYVWNDPIYHIQNINTDPNGGFSFDLGMTDYYTYVSHSTKLVEEVYDACEKHDITTDTDPDEAKRAVRGDLNERDATVPNFQSMQSFNPHHTLGSLVTTLVRRPNGKHYVIVMDRSPVNVDFPSAMALAPSGVFSPWFNIEGEADLRYQILREFGEEVFSREQLRRPPESATDTEWVQSSVPVSALADLLNDPNGGATLRTTGFQFNALSAAPQVSSLLYIDDPVYASWVYDTVTYENSEMREGNVMMFEAEEALESTLTDNWAPGAAAALSQSLRAAKHELGVDLDFSVTKSQ